MEEQRAAPVDELSPGILCVLPFLPLIPLVLSLLLSCFSQIPAEIMDPYVPPEGDARQTSLSKDGVKQQMQKLRQTAASQLAWVLLVS